LRDVALLVLVPRQHVQQYRGTPGRRHDLDQAHAAVGCDAEARVPTVVRHVHANAVGGADDRVAGLEGDVFVV
jgi:hypothetical protein